MTALWIVLAVVVVLAIVASSVVLTRRSGRGGTAGAAPPAVETEPPPTPRSAGPGRRGDTGHHGPISAGGRATGDGLPEDSAVPEPQIVVAADLREGMGKTRGLLSGYVRSLRGRGSVDETTWDDLEEALLRADVGVTTTTALLDDLRQRVKSGDLRGPDAVLGALRQALTTSLQAPAVWSSTSRTASPTSGSSWG